MNGAAARLVFLPGDGTGPEVVREARKVLDALGESDAHPWEVEEHPGGAMYYRDHGKEWETASEEAAHHADAILLGAVGWPGVNLPDGNIAGAALVLGLRRNLDLYANVRPCRLYPGVLHRISGEFRPVWSPQNVDLVVVRENTEGLYTPVHGRLDRGGETDVAVDTRLITRKGAERVIRYAFELSRRRGRGAPADHRQRVTCVDKSNVLAGCQFFRETYDRVASGYPGVAKDYAYVDAFTQWVVRNPEQYDVVVSTNMMGDIISDLASVLQGGMGFAAGGNIGDAHAMFEPVHGSAPKHAGKNEVNPMATLFALEMMLRYLGERRSDPRFGRQADRLERTMAALLAAGSLRTYDQGGTVSTSEVGDRVAAAIRGSAV
ncbi:MAG TPA: isocitrate/isopropylmalate dehydrogenase family protein [Thermoplasmata archaeon]|nr:isocitrate/isopropylmalate dehydrogenase family protein [Thermoplasmata archaeon]